jgi:hypothetical protein
MGKKIALLIKDLMQGRADPELKQSVFRVLLALCLSFYAFPLFFRYHFLDAAVAESTLRLGLISLLYFGFSLALMA